jgi:hypothetical protein
VEGETALDYLFRRAKYAEPDTSPRPHVILLDLRLPKIIVSQGREGHTPDPRVLSR